MQPIAEEIQELIATVEKLIERRNRLIMLAHAEGRSIAEIAKDYGVSRQGVYHIIKTRKEA